jgi:hypothetical protein
MLTSSKSWFLQFPNAIWWRPAEAPLSFPALGPPIAGPGAAAIYAGFNFETDVNILLFN